MRRAGALGLRCARGVLCATRPWQPHHDSHYHQRQQQQQLRSVATCSGDGGCSDDAGANDGDAQRDRVLQEMMEKEARALARVALYPHRLLTRPVQPVSPEELRSPRFLSRLLDLSQLASDVSCISFSAPKAHWDAAVLLIKGHPDEEAFEVWVNPRVADAGGRDAVASMCGMWENCVSCGSCCAWVVRPQRLTCYGLDEHGNERGPVVLDGMRARCFQHELDHLHGKSILQTALGPDYVVSAAAMLQRDLWPANYPSAEAAMTGQMELYDYSVNAVVVPPGLQWYHQHYTQSQHFARERLGA